MLIRLYRNGSTVLSTRGPRSVGLVLLTGGSFSIYTGVYMFKTHKKKGLEFSFWSCCVTAFIVRATFSALQQTDRPFFFCCLCRPSKKTTRSCFFCQQHRRGRGGTLQRRPIYAGREAAAVLGGEPVSKDQTIHFSFGVKTMSHYLLI